MKNKRNESTSVCVFNIHSLRSINPKKKISVPNRMQTKSCKKNANDDNIFPLLLIYFRMSTPISECKISHFKFLCLLIYSIYEFNNAYIHTIYVPRIACCVYTSLVVWPVLTACSNFI